MNYHKQNFTPKKGEPLAKHKKQKLISFVLSIFLIIGLIPTLSVTAAAKYTTTYTATLTQDFNGHTYARYDMNLSWHTAKTYCESLGGHLATVTSSAEQDFVASMASKGSKWIYWLGATDEVTTGDWKWITGETWIYTNWAAGEPTNNVNSSGVEHYLEMDNIGKNWQWNVLYDTGLSDGSVWDFKNIGFIGEFDYSQTVTPVTPDQTAKITWDHHFKWWYDIAPVRGF